MRGVTGAREMSNGDGEASKDHGEALKIDGEALKCDGELKNMAKHSMRRRGIKGRH